MDPECTFARWKHIHSLGVSLNDTCSLFFNEIMDILIEHLSITSV